MTASLIGLCIVAEGLAAGWFTSLEPLRQAQAHGTPIHTSYKAFVIVPPAFVSGTFKTLGGNGLGPIFLGAPRGAGQKTRAIINNLNICHRRKSQEQNAGDANSHNGRKHREQTTKKKLL